MHPALKKTAHVLLFVLAFVVFYVGLFVGLQVNANGGTLLWLAAAAIAGLNIWWMIRSEKKGRAGERGEDADG